ncbi:MAG: ABC transporter ATP-binding protein [Opitutales bacterium]
MAQVVLKQLEKIYAGSRKGSDFRAVKKIDLTVEDKEFMVLVGPSGCGKSTTLRMIAGLEEITDGTISIGEQLVNDVPPKDRDIAMVFQSYALYPHMTVFENMAFGLKLRKYPKEETERRVNEAAQILGLETMLQRKPKALSGGQRQRVAVGRAIVRQPKVFLFDEPLSNLDAKMRVSMRAEISKLHERLQATMIYVTHDQVEAMTMGDRICVMNDGEIMQIDEPLNIYNRPANLFVASFIGSPAMNLFKGAIVSKERGLVFEEMNETENGFSIPLDGDLGEKVKNLDGKPVVLGIRPEDTKLLESESEPMSAVVTAKVELSEPMGAETLVYLDTGANSFIVKERGHVKLSNDLYVSVAIDPNKIHLFDRSTGQAL